MKKITLLFLFFFSSLSFINAQDFQGLVVYQSKTKLDIKLDSSRIPPDRQKRIMEMMKRQFEKKYELRFNKTASTYKEQAKLEQPGGQGNFRFFGGGSANLYYKDTKEQSYANQTDLFGKNFLVKDHLKKMDWKLEKESKMIGNYMCFKATATQKINTRGFRFRPGPPRPPRRGDQNKQKDTATFKKDTMPKFRTITAWYTPQIPVNQGPKEYWGLPGLILEVSFDKTMLLATKIILNPKDKKPLKTPDKGKVVTQAEYDKILQKKMKEMQDRFGGGRRKGGDRGIRIRINN